MRPHALWLAAATLLICLARSKAQFGFTTHEEMVLCGAIPVGESECNVTILESNNETNLTLMSYNDCCAPSTNYTRYLANEDSTQCMICGPVLQAAVFSGEQSILFFWQVVDQSPVPDFFVTSITPFGLPSQFEDAVSHTYFGLQNGVNYTLTLRAQSGEASSPQIKFVDVAPGGDETVLTLNVEDTTTINATLTVSIFNMLAGDQLAFTLMWRLHSDPEFTDSMDINLSGDSATVVIEGLAPNEQYLAQVFGVSTITAVRSNEAAIRTEIPSTGTEPGGVGSATSIKQFISAVLFAAAIAFAWSMQ